MRKTLLALTIALALAGCSGDDGDGGAAGPSPNATFPLATVLLDNGERSTLVTVEVAETPEQQERGLSEKDSLPEDEGMAFVFFEETDAPLPMRATSIPLSVAFFDATGTIVSVVDGDPYAPDEPYMGALAVNRGAFEEWDISDGDHVQLTR